MTRPVPREVVMVDAPYARLAQHLDRLPGGFAPSETGAELRLLAQLFTPEEAELAVHLTLGREDTATIAARAGLPLARATLLLESMSAKGLILSSATADGALAFQAAPFIVGIYEFQVNHLTPDFLEVLHEYWRTMKRRPPVRTIPQMRTIPVAKSLTTHVEALPYEQAWELTREHAKLAVAPCICRRHAKLLGKGCDAPEESCLVFGDWADYYVRTGRARAIDRAELEAILTRAEAEALVLQPNNARSIVFICCCCGCCCGVLGALKRHPHPAAVAASSFIAAFDAGQCQACMICLDRCQMEALVAEGEGVTFNAARCIGCGLCVTTCTSGALTLVRKPESETSPIPADIDATWREIARAQAGEGRP